MYRNSFTSGYMYIPGIDEYKGKQNIPKCVSICVYSLKHNYLIYACIRVYSYRHRYSMYNCASPPPPHGQVFRGTVPHKFSTGSSRTALSCEPQRSHVCYFTGKSINFEGREAQATRKSHGRALSPAQFHHIGLYGPACNSKHEGGSPA